MSLNTLDPYQIGERRSSEMPGMPTAKTVVTSRNHATRQEDRVTLPQGSPRLHESLLIEALPRVSRKPAAIALPEALIPGPSWNTNLANVAGLQPRHRKTTSFYGCEQIALSASARQS